MLKTRTTGQYSFFILSTLFLVVSSFLLVKYESSWMLLSLAVIFILSGIIVSWFNFANGIKFLILLLPFSVNLQFGDSGTTVLTPSEPLTGILAAAFFFSIFSGKETISSAFIKHPLTIFILLYLLFELQSVFFSAMVLVSVKAFIVKLVYVCVFYFIPYFVLKRNLLKAAQFWLLYAPALLPVILYSLVRHSTYGFSKEVSSITAEPFFSDHTIFSACIAFVIPPIAIYLFHSKTWNTGLIKKILLSLLLVLLFTGVFFSYCRAAWISLAASALVSGALLLKIKWKGFLFIFALAGAVLFMNRETVLYELKQNKSDSNKKYADEVEQTKSITNISSYQSNAERLNRWMCALRMANDKPFTGFGSGTYQFQYLPYQRSSEMTWISVTSPYNTKQGHGGSAHSEYLLALSEAGIGAFFFFLAIVISAFYYGVKNYHSI